MNGNKDAYDGEVFYLNFGKDCFLNRECTPVTLRRTRFDRNIHGRNILR